MSSSDPAQDLVAVGTPIDLDNCAREPIHIPGSIQPRGVLAVVHEPDFEVRQVSANVTELLGRSVDEVLGRHLSALIGDEQAARIEQAASTFSDLHERNPLSCVLDVDGELRTFDVILHREPGGVLLVELEIAYGERPFSFPNTYQAVRSSVEELNLAVTLTELYETTTRAVRDLTGFDRVMVYRYDDDYNGEVVAESRREDLNAFLGLHYPSTDIPAQARAMYEKSWLRLISDVDYTPAALVPTIDPSSGAPLDLTHATLRSVSPIHVEYLQNMGVHASMSISLLRHGRLWGLIACHHYSGPHLPPFEARVAAEFLGSTLSLRLVDRFDDDQLHTRLAAQAVLLKLSAATLDGREPLTAALFGAPDPLDLVPADGVVVNIEGHRQTRGTVPPSDVESAVTACPATRATRSPTVTVCPASWPPSTLTRRLSPEPSQAEALRRHLVETLYRRTSDELRIAETLQRSLLPQSIPTVPGWQLSAHYEPAAGGRIGGDWYDAFELPDGRLIVLLGDVAGHGIAAAGTMAQLRNVLRAHLFAGATPAEALNQLNAFCVHMMPRAFATVIAARVDLSSGQVEAACAGHLMPYLTNSAPKAVEAPIRLSPPIGIRGMTYAPSSFTVEPGHGLVMYSDGLVERRGEAIDDGIDRLAATLGNAGDVPASWISTAMARGNPTDDITIVTLRRH